MVISQRTTLLKQIRTLATGQGSNQQSDLQLLQRFIAERDEAAFGVLVRRHGSMVLGVARNVLRHQQDAEDVFQAAFLVLARKADTICKQQALSSWLHGVAYRLALKAKGRAIRRRGQETRAAGRIAVSTTDDLTLGELRILVHEELHRLPERYRAPLLLCYWEGKTQDEAARQLGISPGSFKKCLERARNLLGSRLVGRGLVPSAAFFAVLFSDNVLKAAVSSVLTQGTAEAAVAFATGQAASAGATPVAAALAEGVIRVMNVTKWATNLTLVILVSGLGIGLSLATYQALGSQHSDAPVPIAALQEGQGQARAKIEEKPNKANEAAARELSVDNLKQIGIAMHTYHDNNNEFPAHAVYDKDGKTPLLSWRVAILPYVGQQDLYDKFKLDEPWDSAHNKKLIDKMPKIYEPVGAGNKAKGLTHYQVFTGPDTPFDGAKAITIAGITDGTANTILAIEAKDAVTWTKPADLTMPKDNDKLPPVGGLFKTGMNVLFFDASVRFLPHDVSAESFRKYVTPAGGEIIDDN